MKPFSPSHYLQLGSPVLALHPSFSQSFAPAVVVSGGAQLALCSSMMAYRCALDY